MISDSALRAAHTGSRQVLHAATVVRCPPLTRASAIRSTPLPQKEPSFRTRRSLRRRSALVQVRRHPGNHRPARPPGKMGWVHSIRAPGVSDSSSNPPRSPGSLGGYQVCLRLSQRRGPAAPQSPDRACPDTAPAPRRCRPRLTSPRRPKPVRDQYRPGPSPERSHYGQERPLTYRVRSRLRARAALRSLLTGCFAPPTRCCIVPAAVGGKASRLAHQLPPQRAFCTASAQPHRPSFRASHATSLRAKKRAQTGGTSSRLETELPRLTKLRVNW